MGSLRSVVCPENEGLAMFLFQKREEMAQKETYTDRLDLILSKAYKNICDHKDPIRDLKETSKIKGIGNWTLKLLKEYFEPNDGLGHCGTEVIEPTAKKGRGSGRYLPQKGSAPYAILITLYRAIQGGKEFMRKQELIDAAEDSGLSRMPIGPSKSGAPPGRFGGTVRDWYCGWNSMKTLVSKGLVVRSSCPAKYMLTEEGKVTAMESLQRSGILEEPDLVTSQQVTQTSSSGQILQCETVSSSIETTATNTMVTIPMMTVHHSKIMPSISREIGNGFSIPVEFVDKLKRMGFRENEIHVASTSATEIFGTKELASCCDFILKCLLDKQASSSSLQSCQGLTDDLLVSSSPSNSEETGEAGTRNDVHIEPSRFSMSTLRHCTERTEPVPSTLRPSIEQAQMLASTLRPCTSSDASHRHCKDIAPNVGTAKMNVLALPPFENGKTFAELYDVILILDDREQFGHDSRGSNSRQKVADRLYAQFQIQVEIKRLPVGDAIWIARHKQLGQEYVLDFIIERKKVNDFCASIKDNRYKGQKLRLMRCGIQRLIYLIEGDVNLTDASESIKSAAFTTEILEGFDVQRTCNLADTIRKYGNLTHAVVDYYNMMVCINRDEKSRACMSFDEFVNKCHDLEKETVSDVFGVQLMQVPQVTEDVALAVLDHYPTVLSLAYAYSQLEGNLHAQEQLLKDIPIRNKNKPIGGVISKNIYRLIWGEGN